MKINFSKVFGKQYKKLYLKDQKKVDKIINTFIKNPFDKSLNNHHLKWKLKWKNSISYWFDWRIIFKEKDNYVEVLFISVWTHNQVY